MCIGHGWAESHLLLYVKHKLRGMHRTHLPDRWTLELLYPRKAKMREEDTPPLFSSQCCAENTIFYHLTSEQMLIPGKPKGGMSKRKGAEGASADSSCKKH